MSEETLNRLFEQARNEAPETKLSDIQKWIGLGGLSILLAGLLTKMKLIVTLKPFIMISSVIVAVGVGTGAILMLNASDEVKKQEKPVQVKTISNKPFPNSKPNEVALLPVQQNTQTKPAEAPVSVTNEQPVLQMVEDWNNGFVHLAMPNYCLSLPVNPTKPVPPVEPFKAVRVMEDNIDIEDFTALKVWGAVDIILKKGDKAAVRVETHDETCDDAVHINTNGKTLEIYTDDKEGKAKKCDLDAIVYVTVVNLEKISCSGASMIKTEGELKLDKLEMSVSGASDIHMDLAVNNIKIDASGASEIVLDGKAEEMKLVNSGAADFKASGFEVKSANVDCSGASEVSINVTSHLDVKVSGASDVEYTGAATIGNKSISGASDFKHK